MISKFFRRFSWRITVSTLKIIKDTLDHPMFEDDRKAFDKVIEIIETLERLDDANIKVQIELKRKPNSKL